MIVPVPAVVMQVNLSEVVPQDLDPLFKRRTTKNRQVADIQTKPDILGPEAFN